MGFDLLILATFIPVVIVVVAIMARRTDGRHDDEDSPGSHLG